jgi:hypothetical protein
MPDNVEAIALRLRDFIQAAQEDARGRIPMGGIRTEMRRPNDSPKAPILETCEECLSRLNETQCRELDRILEIMLGAFRSPPGAIMPA